MEVLKTIFAWVAANASVTLAVSVLTIAGSIVAYVVKLFLDLADRRRRYFLELVGLLDGAGPIAGKLAAVYELRAYKRKKRDFLLRLFGARETLVPKGGAGDVLIQEMREAYDHVSKR